MCSWWSFELSEEELAASAKGRFLVWCLCFRGSGGLCCHVIKLRDTSHQLLDNC